MKNLPPLFSELHFHVQKRSRPLAHRGVHGPFHARNPQDLSARRHQRPFAPPSQRHFRVDQQFLQLFGAARRGDAVSLAAIAHGELSLQEIGVKHGFPIGQPPPIRSALQPRGMYGDSAFRNPGRSRHVCHVLIRSCLTVGFGSSFHAYVSVHALNRNLRGKMRDG
jgi:hypothetical protein